MAWADRFRTRFVNLVDLLSRATVRGWDRAGPMVTLVWRLIYRCVTCSTERDIIHNLGHATRGKKRCTRGFYKVRLPPDEHGSENPKRIPCPFVVNECGQTALHLAATTPEMDPYDIQLMLDFGADVNAKDERDMTPLHWAVHSSSMTLFLILVDHPDTNLDAPAHQGITPLMYAALYGDEFMMNALLEAGADINAKSEDGRTALHYAVSVTNLVSTRYLVQRGANIEARDNSGRTPLYLAAGKGNLRVISYLMRRGADRDAKSNYGFRPRDSVITQLRADIAVYLDTYWPSPG